MLAMKYKELISFDLNWLKKRWLRIATLYYPALICVSLLFVSEDIYSRVKDLVLHFLFLNWMVPSLSYSIISPAWFLVPLMGAGNVVVYNEAFEASAALMVKQLYLWIGAARFTVTSR